jgi:hypothetical protein
MIVDYFQIYTQQDTTPKTVEAMFLLPMRVICPANLNIIYLIILTILCEEYKLWVPSLHNVVLVSGISDFPGINYL